jgi:hypothetical protein
MARRRRSNLSQLTAALKHQNDRLQAQIEKSQGAFQRTFDAIQLLEKRAMSKRRKAKRKK